MIAKIATRESPLGPLRGLLRATLESYQNLTEGVGVWKVARCMHPTPNDWEVEFDLVEPTGVDRHLNQSAIWLQGGRLPEKGRRRSHCR